MKTRGWQKIFSFTFVQYVKSKAFIVSSIIICVLVAAVCVMTNILPNVLNDGSDVSDGEITETDDFYKNGELMLFDNSEILTEDDKTVLSDMFGERYSEPKTPLEDTVKELENTEDGKLAVGISPIKDDGKLIGYEVHGYYSESAESAAGEMNAVISEMINRRVLLNAGVAPEKYEETQLFINAVTTQAGGTRVGELQGLVNYALPMLISIMLFFLIFTYGSIVAQSVAVEKTSRVIELLLTSVRPLAIVIGKVLAMCAVSFAQFFLILGVGAGSFALSAPFGWISRAQELLENPDVQSALSQVGQSGFTGAGAGVSASDLEMAQVMNIFNEMITPVNIICVIILFIMGFLFYSLIAALVGASISRMEDLQAAMSPYSVIGIIGLYLSYCPLMFNADKLMSGELTVNSVQLFSYYCPLSAPFSLPSAVMLGTLSPVNIAVAMLVLAAFVVLIAILVSKVYEAIILHNGNRIKPADIIKMAVRR